MKQAVKWPSAQKHKGAITLELLETRTARSVNAGYSKQKWIEFCETLIAQGFHLHLYEAKHTESKYITVKKAGVSYIVRFSAHKPNKEKEATGDCDFFVGVTHLGVTTTKNALDAVYHFFQQVHPDSLG